MNQNSTLTYEHDSHSGIPVCKDALQELNNDCGGCLEILEGTDGLQVTVSNSNESDRRNAIEGLELMGFELV